MKSENTNAEISVGQCVFLEPTGNNALRGEAKQPLYPATVTAIKRKYIYVLRDGWPDRFVLKVDKESLVAICEGDCNAGYRLWLSEAEYDAEALKQIQISQCRKFFDNTLQVRKLDAKTVAKVCDLLSVE